jgi:hypothetical protein
VSQAPDPIQQELRRAAFDLRATSVAKCLAAPIGCDGDAIRAHSVQNARVLDLLAEDGHVVALKLRVGKDDEILVDFDRIGRNLATTFTGLCNKHDAAIFSPLDTKPFDLANAEHLFLLAYRAVHFELHATINAATQVQGAYRKRVELGLDSAESPSPAGMLALERMFISHLTFQYKSELDAIYFARRFDRLQHDVVRLAVSSPTLAASAMCALGGRGEGREDAVRATINVLPLGLTESAAVFSYLPVDSGRARAHLSRILGSSNSLQKYELSRLLIAQCQNFVLRPSYVASWDLKKRELITKRFVDTVLEPDFSVGAADLMMFE